MLSVSRQRANVEVKFACVCTTWQTLHTKRYTKVNYFLNTYTTFFPFSTTATNVVQFISRCEGCFNCWQMAWSLTDLRLMGRMIQSLRSRQRICQPPLSNQKQRLICPGRLDVMTYDLPTTSPSMERSHSRLNTGSVARVPRYTLACVWMESQTVFDVYMFRRPLLQTWIHINTSMDK